jgi:outer membrane receptor protein involved in Fe transport
MRERLLASTIIAGAMVAAAPGFAQVTPAEAAPAAEAPAGEIVVTGSLIRNPNLTSSTPVSVISDAEIFKRAPGTTEELLRGLPGVSPGIGTQVNNGSNGTNSVDLRGLGTARNLVLLDGTRVVPTLANGAVDLNFIPVALLQRVDVLTGGASTTYGADAVSGVVNFITRKDFSGVDVRSTYKITGRGDGATARVDLTLGGNFADDRGNAVINIGYTKIKPVYQTRGFALFGVSSTTGTAAGSSFTSVPTTISFPTADLQLNPSSTALVPQYQGYNFNPYNIFQTPLSRKSAYAALTYDISDSIEVYARGMGSQNVVKSIIAPSGIFGNELFIPANNPYLPAAVRDTICTQNGIALGATCNSQTALDLPGVYRRLVELGPRVSTFEVNIYDVRSGVRFDLTNSINLDLSGSYGRSEQSQTQSGYVLNSRVQQALNANNATTCTDTSKGCVPLNLFGPAGSISPAQVAFLQGKSTIRITTELKQLSALVGGDLGYTVPGAANPISFAVGGEYRSYTYNRDPDAFAQDPSELGGAGGATLPFKGGYDVKEAYAELIAPLMDDKPGFQELSAEAGVRYSSYAINAPGKPKFNAWTYKGGLTWMPVEGIRFRGNYQRAVRAPNIGELFSPTATGLTNLTVDPCAGAAPTTNANLRAVCLAQGASAATIGTIQNPSAGQANATFVFNTNLKPEKADTFTIGAVLTPRNAVPGLSVSIDYYNITINNAITFATPDDGISACFANVTAASAASTACTIIRRNPANGRLSGNASNTPGLLLAETNLGRLKTSGIDLTVDYTRKFGDVGLNLNFVGNYTDTLRFRAAPTSKDRECVGYYSANCGPIQPKFSWNQRSSLTWGPGTVSLLWRHINKVKYEPGLPALYVGAVKGSGALVGKQVNFNKIPAFNYFDLTTQFELKNRFTISVGIQNLFDKVPPIVGGQAGTTTADSGNTFPSTYDPLGRTFSVSGRVSF